jgi:NAD(P)-dependent dehydrogenase (short-subunit alcohol dehydrogenase family)
MSQFLARLKAPRKIDVPDLTGKVALVTGGKYALRIYSILPSANPDELNTCSSGIGYNTVKQLATHGAKVGYTFLANCSPYDESNYPQVYIGARDEGRATAPLAQLESEGVPKGKVTWLKLDLATIKKAKAGAEEFLTKEKRLDILGQKLFFVSYNFVLMHET